MLQAIVTLAMAAVMNGGLMPDEPAPGFVLITTDHKPYQKWTGEVSLENLRKRFPEEGYTVMDVESGVFTVIDHEVPIIAAKLRWKGLSEVFSDLSDPSAPIDIGSLDKSGKRWVEDTISMIEPSQFWKEGFDLNDASVALRPGLQVAVRTNGRWYFVKMQAQSNDIERARNRKLASRPVRVKPSSQIQQELAREAERVPNPPIRYTPAPTLYVYRRQLVWKADAYITATKALQKLESDLKTHVREAITSLREKMDIKELDGFGGTVPDGQIDIDRLPEGHRRRIEMTFVGSWRSFGFASEDDARIAFTQVKTAVYQLEMTLAWSNGFADPGGRAEMMSGVVFYRGR